MEYFKKNYLFLIFAISIIFVHQIIFQKFFPNENSFLGHDYSAGLPNLMFGKIWFKNNFLSVPWFSPSFCCGTPFFADPQSMYYSFYQLFFILFSPIVSLKLSFLFFSLVGFFGTFFLLHKSFKKNIYISLIAASLFLFNGFFNYRIIIGHLSYASYAFVPFYCYFLIQSFENKKYKSKCFFYNLISSLLFANFIHSGSAGIIVTIVMSIAFIISIHIYLNQKITIINYVLLSLIIGLLISSSKINAGFSFINNFPREYSPLVFENFYALISNTFKSLFLYPDSEGFNSSTINLVTNRLQVHELEFGITILPLIIFAIFIVNFRKINLNALNLKKIIALLFMLVIILFALSINITNNKVGNFFQNLPIIKSTWVNFRLTAIYILPLIIISSFLIDKIFLIQKNIKFFTFFCLVIIVLQNYIYEKQYYNNQKYNHKNIQKFNKNNEGNGNLKIDKILLVLDKNKKPVLTRQRNDYFIYGFSPLLCYNPIFGYDLKSLPIDKLLFDKINKIKDNLFHYTADPILKNNNINFINPSCFVFPNENNCKPGDLFQKKQLEDLQKFLEYKKFKFELSKLQKFFNYVSIIAFILSFSYILYFVFRKKILNI